MSKFEIYGPNKLEGEIPVYGAKNAAMKMIVACVLISGKVTLKNVPDILDIQVIIDILTQNGATIIRTGHTLDIDMTKLSAKDPDPKLVEKMRGSIVLVGPYLSRFGKIDIPKPGGCAIGTRPIETHLDAFRKVGADVSFKDGMYQLKIEKHGGCLVVLSEASVTATENMIMSQVIGKGETVIKNAATEHQIKDLADFLNLCGAKISGAGTNTITIGGVDELRGTTHQVMPDPFETSTFVCMAIVTRSPLKITCCNPLDMYPFLDKLKEIGVGFETGKDYIFFKEINELKPIKLTTAIHPGFSTDMQAPMGLVLTQANGKSYIHETLYENRLGYLKELVEMGAKIDFVNNQEAIIYGPTKLRGRHIESLDLRAGATMVLAGLMAEGKTVIDNAEIVDRGYEKIEERLQKVGAKVKRIN